MGSISTRNALYSGGLCVGVAHRRRQRGLAVIGLTVAAGFLHHVLQGPNRVSEKDDENADRLARGKT